MYFANPSGVLMYNGTDWIQIDVENANTIRSLFKASDGKIYVGGKTDFGYLEKMDYFDLFKKFVVLFKLSWFS